MSITLRTKSPAENPVGRVTMVDGLGRSITAVAAFEGNSLTVSADPSLGDQVLREVFTAVPGVEEGSSNVFLGNFGNREGREIRRRR